ncbi:flavin reductase [Streptomyces sp. CB03234]|uniref:flavin reductase family protein n=1 Tax=Streptomyces sp. (strain CB03234) TaxID=1703937 RepID=UPI00076F3474|nr:flavin reductase family protein [Streptomyces sp. CB03234]AME17993.1 flavin reductase [Streptomyces sp. CB03234]OKJ95187.1 flavin reductase [Streptomyces sp. CB03234]
MLTSTECTTFLDAMAAVPGPVAVVTTVDPSGAPWGFTASSFCSLSLHPPLILVCLAKSASCHPAFTRSDAFLVNVLADDQADIAHRFGRTGLTDKFADGPMTPTELGIPGLLGAASRLVCATHAVLDGGDHNILVGRVHTAIVQERRTPLVYCNRRFTSTARAGSR